MMKATEEQPEEEIQRARSERVPRAGAPVLVELACIPHWV